MDRALSRLDAAGFLQMWRRVFDRGYIEGKELDAFFHLLVDNSGMTKEGMPEDELRRLRQRFGSVYDIAANRRLRIQELATVMLPPEEENFLLMFRRETPLDNSVEFMRIWRSYDTDSSGYLSALELKELFLQHRKSNTPEKLEQYTITMMKMFDKNMDGRLDLSDLARILDLKENFLLKFKMDASSQEDRRRDFEKIFAHYDLTFDIQRHRPGPVQEGPDGSLRPQHPEERAGSLPQAQRMHTASFTTHVIPPFLSSLT
ncbi:secretagogin-like isoform X2 [Pseudoliparis swirei]|uniref:secretagogin-like isoform X2 n=1 Tax=Pseudoliparis swirei TaxID=2059687 RepID=UPI0024BEF710|nr:secretagogin-like isoform X2 [Pseudoliparis swirei]